MNTTDRVLQLHQGDVSRRTAVALEAMDAAIVEALKAAKDAGVPQGLIVGLLHGFAHRETAVMMRDTG